MKRSAPRAFATMATATTIFFSSANATTPSASAITSPRHRPAGTQPFSLDNSSWTLQPESLGAPVPPDVTISAHFRANRLHGRSACNYYWASYRLGPGYRLAVGGIATTRMFCRSTDAAERIYLHKLQTANRYALIRARQGDRLQLSGPAGSLRFTRLR